MMIQNFIITWFISWVFTLIIGFGGMHLSGMQFWLLVGSFWLLKTVVDYVFSWLSKLSNQIKRY